jgi:hypothetical protein
MLLHAAGISGYGCAGMWWPRAADVRRAKTHQYVFDDAVVLNGDSIGFGLIEHLNASLAGDPARMEDRRLRIAVGQIGATIYLVQKLLVWQFSPIFSWVVNGGASITPTQRDI